MFKRMIFGFFIHSEICAARTAVGSIYSKYTVYTIIMYYLIQRTFVRTHIMEQ